MKSYKKPYRVKKRKSIFRSRFFWLALLILFLIGGIFYSIFFLSYFQVKKIEISGNQKTPTEEIKTIIAERINSKVVFFVSESIFIIDVKGIRQEILKKYPQILEVKIKRNLPDILVVEIKERVPVGTFCQQNDCFYIDEFGVVFKKSSQETQPIIKSEVFNPNLILGQSVLEKKYLEGILKINNNLTKNLELNIKEFVISGDGKKLKTEIVEGWRILFDLEENISDQIYNLDLTLKEKIPPEQRKNLNYIDLRFGNKVFYK